MTEHVTDENQLDTVDGRQYPHTDCGLAVAAGMAIDAGHAVGVAAMEGWYTAHGDSPYDGTGTDINAAFLASLGLTATAFYGDMDLVDTMLAKGWRVGLAIYSNHYGYPYSGPGNTGHFLELVELVDGGYRVMQPVGGIEVVYTRQLLVDNAQGAGWVCQFDYRGAGVTPVPGSHSGGVPMLDGQVAATMVKSAYIEAQLARFAMGKGFDPLCLEQDVKDPSGVQSWVDKVVTGQEDIHSVTNDLLRIITSAA